MHDKMGTITNNDKFWGNVWSNVAFRRYIGIEPYLAMKQKLYELYRRFLPYGSGYKVLEVGCATGKQLIYFAKRFNYQIYGVDISYIGALLTKANLVKAGVDGIILNEDILNTSFPKESFDVVYSMGLIEHYDNPNNVIDAHINMLKKRGIIIITIPNFGYRSLYMDIQMALVRGEQIKEIANINIMKREKFIQLFNSKPLVPLYQDYYGVLQLSMALGLINNKLLLYPMAIINEIIGYLLYYLPKSSYYSPYLVYIGRKE